jgi:uncharacterized membrane protein
MMNMAGKKRTVVKTLTYRTMNGVYAFTAGFMVTGKIEVALTLVGMEFAYKMVAYFIHERIWATAALKTKFM